MPPAARRGTRCSIAASSSATPAARTASSRRTASVTARCRRTRCVSPAGACKRCPREILDKNRTSDARGAGSLGSPPMGSEVHTFHALAFVENFSLKELVPFYPEGKRVHQHLAYPAPAGGTVYIYSFGAVVFHN